MFVLYRGEARLVYPRRGNGHLCMSGCYRLSGLSDNFDISRVSLDGTGLRASCRISGFVHQRNRHRIGIRLFVNPGNPGTRYEQPGRSVSQVFADQLPILGYRFRTREKCHDQVDLSLLPTARHSLQSHDLQSRSRLVIVRLLPQIHGKTGVFALCMWLVCALINHWFTLFTAAL